MFNHHRGLWGYSGTARDGSPLTVQATGIGGPSAAIVVEELIGLGARTLIRIGTCGALVDDIELGTVVPVESAISADGTSRALGANERVAADACITSALADASGRAPVACVSTDLFYDARVDVAPAWASAGAALVEMEAAAVLQVAAQHEARAGCVLAVTDLLARGRVRADYEAVERMGTALGETAWAALELAG
jgi:uridine phosphorylase